MSELLTHSTVYLVRGQNKNYCLQRSMRAGTYCASKSRTKRGFALEQTAFFSKYWIGEMMNKKMSMVLRALALAGLATAASASHASLIQQGPEQQFQGTGLGAVNTVLTITSAGNSTTESGAVIFNGTTAVTSGDTLAINNTPTLGSIGVTSASDLRIVFNAQEPGVGSGNNGITLDKLALSIFDPTGKVLFNSGAFVPATFATTQTGVGRSGVVFALDAVQAGQAQAAAFGSGFANNRIGLSATALNATGGPETFYALSFGRGPIGDGTVPGAGGTVPGAAVPEPGTVALLGLGLLGFVATRRKKA
jgi:hypothetical protein